jgi:DNA-binding CsgD family transcriptional regulator
MCSQRRAQVEEAEYEVSIRSASFGSLRSLRTFSGEDVEPAPSTRCYRALRGRGEPCADCPVAAGLAVGQTRTTVRLVPPQAYEVITATVLDRGRARVRLRRIWAEELRAIHEAKVRHLAARGGLSARERDVLEHLLMGRSIAEMAVLLQITPRTVKFHQANVLEKLGVESRSDLLRLVH